MRVNLAVAEIPMRALRPYIQLLLLGPVFVLGLFFNGAAQSKYEVIGKVLQSDGKPFTGAVAVVFLESAFSPFAMRSFADRSGQFKFKNVSPGTYNLVIHVPRRAELRKTIEVGPSLADSKNKITLAFQLEPGSISEDAHLISTAQLSLPAEAKKQYWKAQDRLEKRDVEGAIAELKKAVRIAPQFVEAWNFLGTIAYTSRRYRDAETYFRQALEQDADAYSPLVNLGGALLSLGRFDEALPLNQRAVSMRPDDPLAHSQLGQNYYFLGRYDDAEPPLRRAKALDPGHFTFPQIVLAAIYERRNDMPSVIRELEDFLQRHPDSDRADPMRIKLKQIKNPPG